MILSIALLIVCLVTVAVAQKPQAALPQATVNTAWKMPEGTTWTAHTSAQFSSAPTPAQPNDGIVLDAGVVYSGNFRVPAKSTPREFPYSGKI